MIADSKIIIQTLTLTSHFNTTTGYIEGLEWTNTSSNIAYILQVYDENTGGRYNYKLTPTGTGPAQKVDGFVSAPRADTFVRITGTVPYTPPS